MNAVLVNFLFLRESWKKYHGFHKKKKLSNTTVFNIDNSKKYDIFHLNHHIRIISEGSSGTEWLCN